MKKITFLFLAFFISNCITAQTQAEMTEKAGEDFKKVDTELNIVYKKIIGKLSAEEKQKLIAVQKNWLKFRDSQCDFTAGQFDGGSMQPIVYAMCLEQRTKNRIADLKQEIKDRTH